MTRLGKTALWVTIPLLLLSTCSPGGAWGTTPSTAKWDSGPADDSGEGLPGITSGAISRIVLEMGDKGVFCLAIWSSADHDCSSGAGPAAGGYVEGQVRSASGGPYPISLSCSDGVHLTGTIGERKLDLEESALLLVHADAEHIRRVHRPGTCRGTG